MSTDLCKRAFQVETLRIRNAHLYTARLGGAYQQE